MPQVAFHKFGESEWYWFQEADLDRTELRERFRIDADTLIAGPPDEEVARLCRKLNTLGVVFKKMESPGRHRGLNQMFAEPVLDDIIFRGVAKIAFNFLANMLGVSFALRKEFDGVRDYIRLGRKTHSLVTVKRVSNLKHDDGISRRPGGHCVIVTRALFDHLTYEVVLSERYPTIWYPLNYGRDFDLQAQRISQLEEQVQ